MVGHENTFVLEQARVFDAPPEQVFGLLTEPTELARLEFTFRWDEPAPDDRETVVELSLGSLDGRTTVTLTQGEFATVERLELHRSGWTDSFEKLDAVLKV